jgi:hypothetical protein
MSFGQFLYRYIFRGIGLVLLAAVATIIACALGCCQPGPDRATDARQKAQAKRLLDAMHQGSDEAIRNYQKSQLQHGKEGRP